MLKSPCLVIRESRRTESPVSPTSPGAVTRGGGGGTPSKRDPELFRRRGLNLQLLQLQQLQQLQQTSVRTGARGCGTPSRLHRSSPRNAAATRDQLRGSARGGDGGGGGVCANEDWDGGDDGDGGGDGGDGDAPVRLTLARLVRRVERVVRELSETQARVSEGRQLLESRLGEKERLSEQLRLAHDSLHDVNAQGGQGAWLIVISIFTLLVSMLLASMWPRIVRGGGVY
ncbi:uncharacterized protein LOC116949265 isoform X2 [Petromyzon marinus]|uniref:uncharacterized protein LOC116949265 isoform X2 n=1 Tax=Petromyzon marinus TaxID=7757 RepID=UPI003F6F77A5